MASADPVGRWITYREYQPPWRGQWQITCSWPGCGWTGQAAARHIAGEAAMQHLASHGVTVETPAAQPQRAEPYHGQPVSMWAMLAQFHASRRR